MVVGARKSRIESVVELHRVFISVSAITDVYSTHLVALLSDVTMANLCAFASQVCVGTKACDTGSSYEAEACSGCASSGRAVCLVYMTIVSKSIRPGTSAAGVHVVSVHVVSTSQFKILV